MDPQITRDLHAFYPEITITLTLLAVIVVDLAAPAIRKSATFLIAAFGLLVALACTVPLYQANPGTLFYGTVALDQMAVFFKGFLILTSFLVLLAAPDPRSWRRSTSGSFMRCCWA